MGALAAESWAGRLEVTEGVIAQARDQLRIGILIGAAVTQHPAVHGHQLGVHEAAGAHRPDLGAVLAIKDRQEAVHAAADIVVEDDIRKGEPGMRAPVLRVVRDLDHYRPPVEQGRVGRRQPGERIDDPGFLC